MSRVLLTTPTGNTGRHALTALLAAGRTVRVLVRDARKLAPEDAKRVEVIEGDGRDVAALEKALIGVDTAFYCTPQSANPPDLDSYYREFAEPFAAAAKVVGLRRVVSISGGDDLPEPKGPGGVLRMTENLLDAVIPNARHVRCGYFMENLLWQVAPLAFQGAFYLPVARATPLPFVAAADIGRAAGALLADDAWTGVQAVEAYGPQSLSCDAAADRLAEALSTPVRFEQADPARWVEEMIGHGLSPAMATSLRDMFDAISEGRDMGGIAKHPLPCPTRLGDWARQTLAPALAAARSGR
jgi:uncharacterized protein YbjT (DUF2867 family)